jgi:hypothetical protein
VSTKHPLTEAMLTALRDGVMLHGETAPVRAAVAEPTGEVAAFSGELMNLMKSSAAALVLSRELSLVGVLVLRRDVGAQSLPHELGAAQDIHAPLQFVAVDVGVTRYPFPEGRGQEVDIQSIQDRTLRDADVVDVVGAYRPPERVIAPGRPRQVEVWVVVCRRADPKLPKAALGDPLLDVLQYLLKFELLQPRTAQVHGSLADSLPSVGLNRDSPVADRHLGAVLEGKKMGIWAGLPAVSPSQGVDQFGARKAIHPECLFSKQA